MLNLTDRDSVTTKAVKQEVKKDLEDRYHKITVERINQLWILDTRSYHFLIPTGAEEAISHWSGKI